MVVVVVQPSTMLFCDRKCAVRFDPLMGSSSKRVTWVWRPHRIATFFFRRWRHPVRHPPPAGVKWRICPSEPERGTLGRRESTRSRQVLSVKILGPWRRPRPPDSPVFFFLFCPCESTELAICPAAASSNFPNFGFFFQLAGCILFTRMDKWNGMKIASQVYERFDFHRNFIY